MIDLSAPLESISCGELLLRVDRRLKSSFLVGMSLVLSDRKITCSI
jgi:hypothetical protein